MEADPQEENSLELSELTEDSRKELVDIMEQHYLRWVDEKIPALDGKTPKEAVLTPEGQVQVSNLINDWENMQLREPNTQFPFDFNKLRSVLGIENE